MKKLLFLLVCTILASGCDTFKQADAWTADARQLLSEGRLPEARIAIKNALKKDPGSKAAKLLTAQIAIAAGEFQVAERELSELSSSEILADKDASIARWQIALAKGDATTVVAEIERNTTLRGDPDISTLLSTALAAQGKLLDALQVLRDTRRSGASELNSVVLASSILARLGSIRQAKDELQSALKGSPDSSVLRLSLAELHIASGTPELAVPLLESEMNAKKNSELTRNRARATLLLVEALLQLNQAERAAAVLSRFKTSDLQTPMLAPVAARVAMASGRVTSAIDRLTGLGPLTSTPPIAVLLANAYALNGNNQQAETVFRQLVKAYPSYVEGRLQYARYLARSFHPNEAIQVLTLSAQPNPDAGSVESALAPVRQQLVDQVKAAASRAALLRERIVTEPANARLRGEYYQALLESGSPDDAVDRINEGRESGEPPHKGQWPLEFLVLHAANRVEDARKHFRTYVSDARTSVAEILQAADIADRLGHPEWATELLDAARAREPSNTSVARKRVALLIRAGSTDAASALLRELKNSGADSSQIHGLEVQISLAEGKLSEAIEIAKRAFGINRRSAELAVLLATAETARDPSFDPRPVFDSLVANAAPDGSAAALVATHFAARRQYSDALPYLITSAEQRATSLDAWLNVARLASEVGKLSEGRRAAVNAWRIDPMSEEAGTMAIRLAVAAGDMTDATRLADKATARFPTSAAIAIYAGDVAYAERDFKRAIEKYSAAASGAQGAQAVVKLSLALEAAKKESPERPMVYWLKTHPNDSLVKRALSEFYIRAEEPAEAARQLEELLELYPNDVAALNNLAWVLGSSDNAKALEVARRASALSPTQPEIADTLGWLLLSSGTAPDEAKKLLGHAAAALPSDSGVLRRYAASIAAQDLAGAQVYLQRAIDLERASQNDIASMRQE